MVLSGAEIVELTEMFFKDDIHYDEEGMDILKGEQVPEVLSVFKQHLETVEEWVPENIQPQIKATQKATGQKGKLLFMPIRVATTGVTHGPELPKSIALLGKQVVLKRLESAIELLSK